MQTPRSILRDVLGVAFFLIALWLVTWRSLQLRRPDDAPSTAGRSAMCDFQDVIYYPTRAAWTGVNPYEAMPRADGRGYRDLYPAGNPFPVYTPLIFLVSLPFAVLPLPAAEIAYWLTNVVLLLVLAIVSLRLAGVTASVGGVAGLGALLLLSRPGHANVYFGQVALPMVLASMGAWQLATTRSVLSGCCLAIALIKPTFGGPLLLLMLARGYVRAVLMGCMITAVSGAAWLGWFAASDPSGPSIGQMLLVNQAETEADPNVDPRLSGNRIDVPHVVERLVGAPAAPLCRYVLPLAMVGVAGWQLRRRKGAESFVENSPCVSLSVVCVTIAACIYHGVYDALLLTLPAVAASAVLPRKGGRFSSPDALLSMLLLVPAVNYFSSKQFMGAVSQLLPLAVQHAFSGEVLWTVASTINGLALGVAWCILLWKSGQCASPALASAAT